jgi:hypothetical protein
MPLLAAAVGVLGGVGGAYIGGVVANNGQEQQSKSERAAELQDARRVAYQEYLGTAMEVLVSAQAHLSPKDLTEAYTKLNIAQGPVLLVTGRKAVEDATIELTESFVQDVSKTDEQQIRDAYRAAKKFLRLARAEIKETAE